MENRVGGQSFGNHRPYISLLFSSQQDKHERQLFLNIVVYAQSLARRRHGHSQQSFVLNVLGKRLVGPKIYKFKNTIRLRFPSFGSRKTTAATKRSCAELLFQPAGAVDFFSCVLRGRLDPLFCCCINRDGKWRREDGGHHFARFVWLVQRVSLNH